MPKFFISDSSDCICRNVNDTITIVGNDAHHISKTLRMKVGDLLTVTDSCSTDYKCAIEEFTQDSVVLRITDASCSTVESDISVCLFQALIKGDKMDTVVQKAVELGVSEIYPVASDRSVVKLDKAGEKKKTERWNRIALEAAKQCGRGIIPKVHNVIDFKTCIEEIKKLDVNFFCYELADQKTLKDIIQEKKFSSVGFFIGPEGGVSPSEADIALNNGVEAVSLGSLILRTETAGPAVMAMLLYETRL